MLNLFIALLSK